MEFLSTHYRLFILNLISISTFIFLSFIVFTSYSPIPFDVWAYENRSFLESTTLTNLMIGVSNVFDPIVLSILVVILFFFLIFISRKENAYLFLFSIFGGLSSVFISKKFFAIERPLGDVIVSGSSFPSGHATIAAIFFLTILFTLDHNIKSRTLNFLLALVAFGAVFLTGLSRVYLGVHWISDVLAGFALGVFWLSFSFIIFYFIRFKYKQY